MKNLYNDCKTTEFENEFFPAIHRRNPNLTTKLFNIDDENNVVPA